MAGPAIWTTIAATLTAEITAGSYAIGDRLPTEAQLAQRFGVNRHTVRHALAALAQTGSIRSRRGAGVFVAGVPTDYPIGRRVRFHQNVLASGRSPSRQILRIETRMASATEVRGLDLPSGGAVHLVEGISLVNEVPMAVFASVFPAERFPDFPAALTRLGSITAALACAGVEDYIRASTRLTAELADAVQARHLGLEPGAPLLHSVTVNVDTKGRPVELGSTWFAGDRVTLTVKPE